MSQPRTKKRYQSISSRYGDAEERSYSAHRGGRYDSDEDRMAPEPPGPRVFSRVIRSMPLPNPFRPPTSIA